MLKFNRKNESGRSMVEMLGVLAIVGVLSVAGIAGYTTAMNSHRANEAINRVMRLAILVSSQKQLGQPASLSGIDADNVTLTQTEEGKFTLTLSGLSPAVRTRIASMDLATATLGTDAQGNPTFTFSNDLSERSSGSSDETEIEPTIADGEDCTKDAECLSGKCGTSGKCLLSGYKDCSSGADCASGLCQSNTFAKYFCYQKEGDRCQNFEDGGNDCDYTLVNGNLLECICNRCTIDSLKSAGADCTQDCECESEVCLNGKCITRKSGGSSCTDSKECTSGVCSSTTHKCLGASQELCTTDEDCASGTCFDDTFNLICL